MMLDEIFEKYCYIDADEKWQIKDDAPEEAKEIFNDYMNDNKAENGTTTLM